MKQRSIKIRRALLSVSDKMDLIPLARILRRYRIEILSTGGTLRALKKAKIPARSITEITGFPEMLDGRLKTLHPKIHGGILYRRERRGDEREIQKHGILPIDLVVVNLYPFEAKPEIENIDIGGPTLLRAAAKNFEWVTVLADPEDYPLFAEEMRKTKGRVSLEFRARLAQKVFERTSVYDRAIEHYLRGPAGESLPSRLDVIYKKVKELRYGENPHQRGALYRRLGKPRFDFKILHGKELSFNNLLDFEAAVDILREFDQVAACVVKHTNPCGIAEGKRLQEAVAKAIDSDPMSAFGGIVGLNRPCDLKTARKIYELLSFLEIIVAPKFESHGLRFLKQRKNVRLIEIGKMTEGGPWDLRFTKSGILLQDRDHPIRIHEKELRKKLRGVTRLKVGKEDLGELLFAWKCVKTVRSNAIVITQNRQTVGIGAGQMSRVDAVEVACLKAGFRAQGAFLASDAFFPMPDSIERAAQAGIRAVIQPGGSIRDKEVIRACDEAGIAMVFTGERHFRH